MEEKRLTGICIGTRKKGDNDKMLSLFCSDGCIYDALARGALKPNYKLKFASQLFSCCDYSLNQSKAGYYVMSGAGFSELSFLRISESPEAYTAACVVCEAVKKGVLSQNTQMYAEVAAALTELSLYEDAYLNAILLRVLLAAFYTNGYGVPITAGKNGEACSYVLSLPIGEISQADISKTDSRELLKACGSRFASRFGTLNSLHMFLDM